MEIEENLQVLANEYFRTVLNENYEPGWKSESKVNIFTGCSGQGKTTFVFWLLKDFGKKNYELVNSNQYQHLNTAIEDKNKLWKLIYLLNPKYWFLQEINKYFEKIFDHIKVRSELIKNPNSHNCLGLIPFFIDKKENIEEIEGKFGGKHKLTFLGKNLYAFKKVEEFKVITYYFFDEMDFYSRDYDQDYKQMVLKTQEKVIEILLEKKDLKDITPSTNLFENIREEIIEDVLSESYYPNLFLSVHQKSLSNEKIFLGGTYLLSNESIKFMYNNKVMNFSITLLNNGYLSNKSVENGCIPWFGTLIQNNKNLVSICNKIKKRKEPKKKEEEEEEEEEEKKKKAEESANNVLIYTFAHFGHLVSNESRHLIQSAVSHLPGQQAATNGFYFFPCVLYKKIWTSGTFECKLKPESYSFKTPDRSTITYTHIDYLQSAFNSFFVHTPHLLDNFLLIETYLRPISMEFFNTILGVSRGRVLIQAKNYLESEQLLRGLILVASVHLRDYSLYYLLENILKGLGKELKISRFELYLLEKIEFPYLIPSYVNIVQDEDIIKNKLNDFKNYIKENWDQEQNIGLFYTGSNFHGTHISPFDAHCLFINSEEELVKYNFEFRDQNSSIEKEKNKVKNERKRKRKSENEIENEELNKELQDNFNKVKEKFELIEEKLLAGVNQGDDYDISVFDDIKKEIKKSLKKMEINIFFYLKPNNTRTCIRVEEGVVYIQVFLGKTTKSNEV